MYAITFPELDIDTEMLAGLFASPATTIESTNGVDALDWTKARCRDGNGTLTHLFFSDEPIAMARAKAICGKCPLSAACLEGALDRAEPWGIWGGELIETGRIIANKRPRGRPPKHPRPVVIINEDAIAVPVRVA
jgi:WhiB family redox-sensing transcriptional regulator